MAVGCWPARKLLGSGIYSVRCLHCVLCTRCVHTSLLYMYKEDYTKLGIPENSSIEEIKSAYFKKAKELHPDSRTDNLNEETDFIDLTNAYKRLVYESKFGTDSFNVTDPRNDPRRQEYWDIRKRTKSTKEIKVEEEILRQRREKERTMLRKAFLGLMLGIFFGTIFPALFIGENDYKEVCTCGYYRRE
ncbi:dnaJ homolog subfamily C member 4 isoform X3 [Eurytemora carolleeae]|uniref:dnaJ homolog subfamily C member 4 isoform X3 n=1 Tax=Eurytemora carolleeae TaxID=1294199 RepID=UPI000C77F8AB|nr:dnaJ homolog subfamily C member 4 isoform X3 [Eurytemora carolleeae]|eukprot:XP_023342538.1 dnaJ homolog subfamily C member 4-like isoform X3 [Eurytemora affinis]